VSKFPVAVLHGIVAKPFFCGGFAGAGGAGDFPLITGIARFRRRE
jgi:hypothetical protein